jgi:hypothetical protein
MTSEELTLVMQKPFMLPNYAATVEDMIGRAIRKAVRRERCRRERCRPKKIPNATNTRIWPGKTLAYVSEMGAVKTKEAEVHFGRTRGLTRQTLQRLAMDGLLERELVTFKYNRKGWVYTVAESPLTDEQRSFYEGT